VFHSEEVAFRRGGYLFLISLLVIRKVFKITVNGRKVLSVQNTEREALILMNPRSWKVFEK